MAKRRKKRPAPARGLQAPFPYFGSKRKAAAEVWRRFGDVPNYVEPFFGSGAVLLARPTAPRIETVNDLDGLVVNFWRAVRAEPDAVAAAADRPASTADLTAMHLWLAGAKDGVQARIEADRTYYDAEIAGAWAWGLSCWIGSGFCTGSGPWQVVDEGGTPTLRKRGEGPNGVTKKMMRGGRGVSKQMPQTGRHYRGVNRQTVHAGDGGRGVNRRRGPADGARRGLGTCVGHLAALCAWMAALADRLRMVRVHCGQWDSILSRAQTTCTSVTGVFLDPPYGTDATRRTKLYRCDDDALADAARAWAVEHGDDPRMRIALCGYEGEHTMPTNWTLYKWTAQGGYGCAGSGAARTNRNRERIYFSPHCLVPTTGLFPTENTGAGNAAGDSGKATT